MEDKLKELVIDDFVVFTSDGESLLQLSNSFKTYEDAEHYCDNWKSKPTWIYAGVSKIKTN